MIKLLSAIFLWAISASQVLSDGYCAAVYVETHNPWLDRQNSFDLRLREFTWSSGTLVFRQGEENEQTYKCSDQRCLWMASDFSAVEEITIRVQPTRRKETFAYSASWYSRSLQDVEMIDGVAVPRRVTNSAEVKAMLLCDAALPEDWLVGELSPSAAPVSAAGPPLTGGEKAGLRAAINRCWSVGALSADALGTTVVIAVQMEQNGRPISRSIRLVSSSGGSATGERQAFEAARRAIIRCGTQGFGLPVEKYDQWREIELTFNPEGLQFR